MTDTGTTNDMALLLRALLLVTLVFCTTGCALHWEKREVGPQLHLDDTDRVRITQHENDDIILDDARLVGDSIQGLTRGPRECVDYRNALNQRRRSCQRPLVTRSVALDSVSLLEVEVVDGVGSAVAWVMAPIGILGIILNVDKCSEDESDFIC